MNPTTKTRALSAFLTAAMAISLAACGKTAEEPSQEPKQNTESAPTEYVYTAEFQPVSPQVEGSLMVKAFSDEGVYASCTEKTGRNVPESADISNMSEEQLSAYDVYEDSIYFISNDGKASKIENFKPIGPEENTEGYKDFYSQGSVDNLIIDDGGNILETEYVYTGGFNGPEGMTKADENYYDYYQSKQSVYIRVLDSTGAELKRARMDVNDDQYLGANIVLDPEGNVICVIDSTLVAFNTDGEIVYSIPCNDYIESLIKTKTGEIYVSFWGNEGLKLCTVDTAAKALGASYDIPGDAYNLFPGDSNYDLYYTSGLNFYGYDIETSTAELLLNWLNCDINSDNVGALRLNDDGSIKLVISEVDFETETFDNQLATISKTPYDQQKQKQTLTLSCLSIDYTIKDAIIKFNRNNDSSRIEIKDYSLYNTEDDYSIGTQKLITELLAGDAADIIALEGLPYSRLAAKGMLEDLYPYLDSDSELQRDDLFQNVLSVLEVDGKLYGIAPSFHIDSVMGATSVVGDRSSWTYDEFSEALASMPEGCQAFDQYFGRNEILSTCASLDMDSFLDWNSKKCSFDSQQFIDLLEFANKFPDIGSQIIDDGETPKSRIASGKQMLLQTGIYNIDAAMYDSPLFGGQETKYIGYPTLSGSGNAISTEGAFAISSSCKDKEAAWQFLRSLLSEDYQKANVWTIPTNVHAFEYKLADMMKICYSMDENGQFILDENGEKIKEPRYFIGMEDGSQMAVYAMTQEQADEISSVVKGVDKAYTNDVSVMNIIQEEVQAYFAGQKTAEEVANIIQGKVNIYINEQS